MRSTNTIHVCARAQKFYASIGAERVASDEHFFNAVVRALLAESSETGAGEEGEHAWLLSLASDEYRIKVEALFLTTGTLRTSPFSPLTLLRYGTTVLRYSSLHFS